jgi:ATP synthase protein I
MPERRQIAEDARKTSGHEQPSTDEAALAMRLRRLGERLGQVHPERRPGGIAGERPNAASSAIARGFRLSAELVAGVLVGAAIGWLLDRRLRISPWGMIVFLLLGFAAGVLNVMRVAGVLPVKRPGTPGSTDKTARS